jgi:hypothetical protein
MGICKELDDADVTDNTVKDIRRLAPTPSIQDLAPKTPQGNTVDAGADYPVPYSTTKNSRTSCRDRDGSWLAHEGGGKAWAITL